MTATAPPPVRGCDSLGIPSSVPPTARVWGFYPYVWTAEQVAALKVDGVYPIFVPGGGLPENRWWTGNIGQYLADLLNASPLSLPHLCPAELDIEEGQAEQMTPVTLTEIGHLWARLCLDEHTPLRIPWVYGGEYVMAHMPPVIRRHVAQWDYPAGQAPTVPPNAPPPGYAAHQYAGNVPTVGGLVDWNVYAQGYRFATPDLSRTIVIGPRPGRVP